MKKRIALVIIVLLYLIVPAVIKKIPVYEYIGKDKAILYETSLATKIKSAFYRTFKSKFTVNINGEKVTFELDDSDPNYEKYNGKYLFYHGITETSEFSYTLDVDDKSAFGINVIKGDIKISDNTDPYVAATEVLSQLGVDTEKYTNVEHYSVGVEGINVIYFFYIDEYNADNGAINVILRYSHDGLYLSRINLLNVNNFSKSETMLDLDEEQIQKIVKEYQTKGFAQNVVEKTSYFVSKSYRGELIIYNYSTADYIYLFPHTAWLVSKYVLGISSTLMLAYVLVTDMLALRRKKAAAVIEDSGEAEDDEEAEK